MIDTDSNAGVHVHQVTTADDASSVPKDHQEQRPAYINLPTKWQRQYGISLHPMARTIHILHYHRSYITYYPYVYQTGELGKFMHTLAWKCDTHISGRFAGHPNIRLIGLDEAEQLIALNLRSWCHKCQHRS